MINLHHRLSDDPSVLRELTAHVIAEKFVLSIVNERNARMALEFKGIKANSLRLMANHNKLNSVLADAVESSDKLISHVGDFKGMSDGMIADIEFAANVLGNSGSGGESSTNADTHTRNSNGSVIDR